MKNLSYLFKIKFSAYILLGLFGIIFIEEMYLLYISGFDSMSFADKLITILSSIGFFILMCVTRWVYKFDKDIGHVRKELEKISAGDFEARIKNIKDKGGVAQLYWSINQLIDKSDAYIRETSAAMQNVAENKYYRNIIETGFSGAYLTGSKTINTAMENISLRVSGFTEVTENFEDKIGKVIAQLNNASTDLDKTASHVKTVADDTNEQAGSASESSQENSYNVQTVSAATEELSSSISEISNQVEISSARINNAVTEIKDTETNMNNLNVSVSKITDVVSLISDIAEQTNLLALNATIEASRAGDAGRGFAVVASEVKNLAAQTAKATTEIAGLVDSIQSATNVSMDGFKSVGCSVHDVDEIIQSITMAIEQQNIANSEIAKSISEVSQDSNNVARNVQMVCKGAESSQSSAVELLKSASSISSQSHILNDEVDSFLKQVRTVI